MTAITHPSLPRSPQRGIGSEIDFERSVGFRHHEAFRRQETAQPALRGPGAPDIVNVGGTRILPSICLLSINQ